jgi:hypothetical protein
MSRWQRREQRSSVDREWDSSWELMFWSMPEGWTADSACDLTLNVAFASHTRQALQQCWAGSSVRCRLVAENRRDEDHAHQQGGRGRAAARP